MNTSLPALPSAAQLVSAHNIISHLHAIAKNNKHPLSFAYLKRYHNWLAHALKRMLLGRELYINDYIISSQDSEGTSSFKGCGFLLCQSASTNETPLNNTQKTCPSLLKIIIHNMVEPGASVFGSVYCSAFVITITKNRDDLYKPGKEKQRFSLSSYAFQVSLNANLVIKKCLTSVYPPYYEWVACKEFNATRDHHSEVNLTLYNKQAFFIMPRLPGITLWEYFIYKKQNMSHPIINGKLIITIAIKIAEQLNSLHNLGIIHRDCHPGNILIHLIDDSCQLHIIDFGLSEYINQFRWHHTNINSFFGFCPEILQLTYSQPNAYSISKIIDHYNTNTEEDGFVSSIKITTKFDIYLLGILLAWLYGVPVNEVKESLKRLVLLTAEQYFEMYAFEICNTLPDNLPPDMKNLIFYMLSYEAEQRPDISMVISTLYNVNSSMPDTLKSPPTQYDSNSRREQHFAYENDTSVGRDTISNAFRFFSTFDYTEGESSESNPHHYDNILPAQPVELQEAKTFT